MRNRLGIVFSGVILILIVAVILLLTLGRSPLNECVNILILGLDEVQGRSRSDTMLLASVKGREVKLLSIPRDLRIRFPDGEFHRVNAAYPEGGARLARKIVSDFLDIPILFYIVIDYQGFEKIIDRLDGVTITVDKHLKYDDQSQELHIDIPPGRQTLSGEEALSYVRYRDESGDIDRIKRQQKLVKALLEKGIQEKPWKEIDALIRITSRYITTNLSLVDMLKIAKPLLGIDPDQVVMSQIPAFPVTIEGRSYLQPRIVGTRSLIDKLIKGIDVILRSEIRVGVLNGNGVGGLAREVAAYLKGEDFHIAYYWDADHFNYKHNFIINLSGEAKKAKMLEDVLKGRKEVVTAEEFEGYREGSLDKIREKLEKKGYNMEGADLLFIFGEEFNLR